MSTQASYLFSKKERLRGEIRVGNLFSKGKAFISYPFRIVYIQNEDNANLTQILISVPKKRFKKAVKRIRLKRQTRECYRLNKAILLDILEKKGISLQIAFTYVSNEELPYKEMEKGMLESFQKLQKEIG